MTAPTTYSEWAIILDKFAKGDDTLFEEMNKGNFVLDAGTAIRFYKKVDDAYKARKNMWLDKFQRSFLFTKIRTVNDIEIVLREGKSNLLPLVKFVNLKGLPKDLQNILHKDLEAFISEIRKSLKDNVSKTENGREKLLALICTFGLFDNRQEFPDTIKMDTNLNNELPNSKGRKIIF